MTVRSAPGRTLTALRAASAGARVLHTNTVGEALCAVLTRTADDGFSVMTAASASASPA